MPEGLEPQTFSLFAAFCLLPYPCWALFEYDLAAFAISLTINVLWLGASVLWVVFRLNRIVTWAFGEIRGNVSGIALSLIWSLPLLILLLALAMLAAEVWQIFNYIPAQNFWTAIGFLLALDLVILVLAAHAEVRERSKFQLPEDVYCSIAWNKVLHVENDEDELDRLKEQIKTDYGPSHGLEMKFGRRETINAIVAAVVFRLVVLLCTLVATVGALYGLSCLLIPPFIEAEWAKSLPSCTQPQPAEFCQTANPLARFRVAVLMAMFGMLDMTVRVVRDGSPKRGDNGEISGGFAGRADRALREQFAVRRIHHACPPDAPQPAT